MKQLNKFIGGTSFSGGRGSIAQNNRWQWRERKRKEQQEQRGVLLHPRLIIFGSLFLFSTIGENHEKIVA